MPRFVTLAIAAVLVSLPMSAQAGALELRLGAFFPRAESTLFEDDSILYTVDQDDWRGFAGGLEYTTGLSDSIHLGFHIDAYGREVHTQYRDFEFEDGRAIRQTLKLNIVPVGVSLRFQPGDGRGRLTPYAAVGADLIFYQYEEFGDFVDFETFDVIADAFESRGMAPGFHVAGGLQVPLNRDWSVFGEARYQWAEDDMGDDFRGSELDLRGLTASLGVRLNF